ncbi:MAG: substrate-binding domain-containing protein, partial [Dongiaceae bacterium]
MLYRLLAAAALVGLAVDAPPANAAGKTICFVTFSLQIAYFQSSVAGGKKAADELGVDLVVLDPQADAGRQVTQVEDCISRNVNAIVVD